METLLDRPERPDLYEPVDLDITPGDADDVMKTFLEFLALPVEERIKLVHSDPKRPRTGDSGYVLKTNQETGGDNKHTFHMTQALARAMRLEAYKLPRVSYELLASTEEIYDSVTRTMRRKYREMEDDFPLLEKIHFPSDALWQHTLRLVANQNSTDGLLARGHYDMGSGTLKIAKKGLGHLRLGYGPEDLAPVESDGWDPIFFRGYGWHPLAEMLGITPPGRAAWHDVPETNELLDRIEVNKPVSDDLARIALILFLDPARIHLEPTEEQTHTPIPWRGMGSLALRSDNRSFLAA